MKFSHALVWAVVAVGLGADAKLFGKDKREYYFDGMATVWIVKIVRCRCGERIEMRGMAGLPGFKGLRRRRSPQPQTTLLPLMA